MSTVVVSLLPNFGSGRGEGFSLPGVLSTRSVLATKQDL